MILDLSRMEAGTAAVIGSRLAKAAASELYRLSDYEPRGPLPQNITENRLAKNHLLSIVYGSGIIYKPRGNRTGFQVCCGSKDADVCVDSALWVPVPLEAVNADELGHKITLHISEKELCSADTRWPQLYIYS